MRKLLTVAAAVALLAGGSVALGRTAGVDITNNGFGDMSITVISGDSVSWKNTDTVEHQVVFDQTACRLSLQPGQTSSCTFTTPGTFTFNDPTATGTGFSGTLTVAQNTRSVTLASNRSTVILGDAVTLSGTVSSKQAGESITILAQPTDQPASSTQVTTASGGAWSLQVQPRANTTYRAQFEGASSTAATVAIRPRITLEKVGRDRFLTVVIAARSMAGKTVELTRWSGNAGWVTIAQQQLQSIARTNTTVMTTFNSGVRLGTKLRVFMRASQTSPDYLDGHSNFVVK